MTTAGRNWTAAIASGLIALAMTSGYPAAQAPSITVAPSNSTILVGQTQQFTATGISAPAMIGGGGYHTCMLMADRSVRCFGENNWGQLGNGGFANSSTPVTVNGLTAAVSVGAGIEHSCALLADGTVRCWGTNFVGQLGDGTIGGGSALPKPVQGLGGAVGLGSGGFHNCAIISDHTVQCWGRNQDGQLGNGNNTTDSGSPQPVTGLTGVVALAAGGYHTCALLADGTVRCWGRNDRGQVGDGTTISRSTPVVVSGMTSAVQISGGLYHMCALLADATVQCWGQNDSGQIGNTQVFSSVPVTVSGIANAVAVSAGVFHSCALLSDGTVRCWGQNGNGQLGNGTTTNSSSPVDVSGLGDVVRVTGAGLHTCAILSNQAAQCWGYNVYGQLGNGNTTDSPIPVLVTGTGGVTWSSSNPAVATIDAGGLATAVAAGTTTITVTDGSGNSGSTTLTVTDLHRLSVTATGGGAGAVSSSPAGIACGADCAENYPNGTVVTLSAAANSGSFFAGWSGGGCSGTGACTVTINADTTVTARFELIAYSLGVSRTGAGSGSVSSNPAGISCGTDCSETYSGGTPVTLTATPANNSTFAGWTGGGCTGIGTCSVNLTANTAVSARFDLITFPVTVSRAGSGTGTVTSNPAGISCGTDCSEPYVSGSSVTLTAVASAGSILTGWSGCDTTSGPTCTVTVNAARAVTATFARVYTLTVQKSGLGSGTVTSSPAAISCGSTCSASFISGTRVTLTANPGPLTLFTGWNGCDSTSGNVCTVNMNAARAVTANFLGLLAP